MENACLYKKKNSKNFFCFSPIYIVSTYKFTVLTLWWFLCWQHKTSWKIYYKNVLRFFICSYCVYSSHYRDHAATILDDEFILFQASHFEVELTSPKKTISWICMFLSQFTNNTVVIRCGWKKSEHLKLFYIINHVSR